MKPEFDQYADEYSKLLQDPIRDLFTSTGAFFFERKWELLLKRMREVGMNPGKSSWLDVGCGQGDLLRIGAPHFARAAGCDLSAEMLQHCENLEVVHQIDPGQLPFADETFDLVTAVCVYHHVLPDSRPALTSEIARVLRPAGMGCIIEHNPFNPATRIIVHRTPVDADAQLLTARTTARLLRGSGLELDRKQYFLYFPKTIYVKIRWAEKLLERVPAGGQYAVFARKRRSG